MSTQTTPRALVAVGTGRYADPWHPFARTGAAVADILRGDGFDVDVVPDVDRALAALVGVDLLVVAAGDPWREGERIAPPAASVDGLAAALARGIGVLALHSAVASLRDHPEWAPAVGAVWLPGTSFHPAAGVTRIRTEADWGEDFDVQDERYCRLQPIGRSTPVAWHEGDEAGTGPEPAAWVREHGAARIAVDVLGHDERSYEPEGHRALVRRLARWTVERGAS